MEQDIIIRKFYAQYLWSQSLYKSCEVLSDKMRNILVTVKCLQKENHRFTSGSYNSESESCIHILK